MYKVNEVDQVILNVPSWVPKNPQIDYANN